MIVGRYFEDDYARDVAWKQHDVYGEALGIIVSRCNRLARFSITVLEHSPHEQWGRIERFDHRTLQLAHDLLAAAWRFREHFQPPLLPFRDAPPAVPAEELWLEWLRNEVQRWIDRPEWVRSVQLILTNQNKPVGYLEEYRLCLGIADAFAVPWSDNLRDVLVEGLARRTKELQEGS